MSRPASSDVCLCHISLYRSERSVQHHGSLWAWAKPSSWICVHHAQSHERCGELSILLTNTFTEAAQPGQTEQVRHRKRLHWLKWQRCLNLLLITPCVPVRVPPFTLLHGTSDIIVPVESSTKFSELLNSLSVKVSLYLLPGVDHTEIVTDLMASDRCFYHPIYSCVKQEYKKLLGTCWHPGSSEKHQTHPQ